ncbi:nuclear hormone receptor HR96 [Venturia canescens]|uniref:nuclear hormone receptor HR96 n=1 Tax=Venturia canescens TaxID=32260 RepID=UPI001C9C7738|nr:nuclear hormone receptor HR96 [Venturia canescens]
MDDMEDEQTPREANKICGVCGDRALGYNFNAVSCESCKAFFRRNALKNKDFQCPFTENCNVTPVTRRFCQKCRLDKCFLIGMRKEYIMTEEDKVLKRHKIEQNRAKKRLPSGSPKIMKMKKEIVDDCNYDNDTSVSIASGISTRSNHSDGYFIECAELFSVSETEYTETEAIVITSGETMSPATAASVPSPSSPPENRDIVGSKSLEMLKDSASTSNFENRNKRILEIGETPAVKRKYTPAASASNSCELVTPPCDSSIEPCSTSTHEIADNQRFVDVENAQGIITKSPIETSTVLSSKFKGRHEDAVTICQKSTKETCPKGTQLVNKLFQDPELIMKFFSNPNFIAKIFEDKSIAMKIMSDPNTVARLANDPQVSEFFEANCETARKDEERSCTPNSEVLDNNGISGNMIRNMLDAEQPLVENPILTNLITSKKNGEFSENKIDATSTTTNPEWNKTSEDVTRDVLQDVERIPMAANSIESILCEAIKLEFSAYSSLSCNQNSRELNDAERAKLNELIVANKALLAPLDDDITNLVGEECRFKGNVGHSDPMLLDVINLTAIAIRRLIKMSKKINAFKNMCQEDQLALLKGGCTEMMILRSALNYDPDKDIWQIPHSQESMSKIRVDVLKEAKGNLYSEHARFVRTFDPRWRDENIILILSAIALFSPDRPRVVHSDVIKLEQNSYFYLLRRYLESVYPGCEAKSTFLKLIHKISELHRLNDEVVGVYLNVNPSSVEPLLIEIFDLKH